MENEYSHLQERNGLLFTSFVAMLTTSAMQQLGKLPNPLTGKAEVQLDAAQWTIDVLVMLRDKMRGNLNKEEQKILNDAITTLQLNFVETAASSTNAPQQSKSEPSDSSSSATDASGDAGADKPFEQKPPKFRKTYGP